MSVEVELSQNRFLMDGGTYAIGLAYHRKNGTLPKSYIYNEYPKMIRISKGKQTFNMSTVDCEKNTLRWTEEREVFEDFIVQNEAEEERILAGGKTNAHLEEERQVLFTRCQALNIKADPSWSAVRLRRELGDKMDAPEPVDKMAALTAELDGLRKMAAMQAEIEALRGQLAGEKEPTDEVSDLRGQLHALGVTADKRWGTARLRDELERATAPHEEAA